MKLLGKRTLSINSVLGTNHGTVPSIRSVERGAETLNGNVEESREAVP